MDEALAETTVDVCGRPSLFFGAEFPQKWAGEFDLALIKEFLSALTGKARISLHAEVRRGNNGHHMAECLFKALGKTLKQAYTPDEGVQSTKGTLIA
jgi:imidazoleglycerol-phosphate dehydratase